MAAYLTPDLATTSGERSSTFAMAEEAQSCGLRVAGSAAVKSRDELLLRQDVGTRVRRGRAPPVWLDLSMQASVV